MSWQEGDILGSAGGVQGDTGTAGTCLPCATDLPKSAAGASPSLERAQISHPSVSTGVPIPSFPNSSFTSSIKRFAGTLLWDNPRGGWNVSGPTFHTGITPSPTPGYSLLLCLLSPGTHRSHPCPSWAAAMGLMPHRDREWGRMRHSPVSLVFCCFGSKTEACGACSPHGSAPPLPGTPRDGCAAGQRLLLKD